MPSNALAMSLAVSMGWRIMRALFRLSWPITDERARTWSTRPGHSGFQRIMTLLAIQVAKASFSQMSSQNFMVTRFPNHWCASSCAAMLA